MKHHAHRAHLHEPVPDRDESVEPDSWQDRDLDPYPFTGHLADPEPPTSPHLAPENLDWDPTDPDDQYEFEWLEEEGLGDVPDEYWGHE